MAVRTAIGASRPAILRQLLTESVTLTLAAGFVGLFLATWAGQKGQPLAPKAYFPELPKVGAEVVRAIGSSPEEPYCQIYVTLISALNSAETQVLLTNAYFVPDPRLLAAWKDAVARGVDVRLLLPARPIRPWSTMPPIPTSTSCSGRG